MNPVIGAGLITGGSGMLGSIIQNIGNRRLANKAQNFELEMWNKANEYNSPAAQMARYKAAGLNPNLIYGSGVASAGNAASAAPKAHIPEYESPINANLAFSVLNSVLDVMRTNAQTNKVEAETKNTVLNYDVISNKLQMFESEFDKKLFEAFEKQLDYKYKRDVLYPYQKDYYKVNLGKLKSDANIYRNRSTISNYDALLSKELFDFNRKNPYLGMLLRTLNTFSGLNIYGSKKSAIKTN